MMASVNEEIESRLTRHQIDLQRLSKGTINRVLGALRQSDSRIVQRLIEDDVSQLSRTRMESLLGDLRRVIDSSYVDATGVLQIELNALAKYEGEFIEDMFGKVIPVKFETVTPSPEQIVAAVNNRPFQGKLLKEVYQELPATTFRKVRDTIRGGFIEGRTTDQIVRGIRGRAAQGYKDGILAKSKRDVEAVVRTAVNHTSNAAREYTYEANDDLIKGVRWVSALDSMTSPVCQARDGKIYEPGRGPRPPAHFNCRSTTSPILKSWRELGFDVDEVPEGTRASMNGQIPAGQDYDAWLRKQPRDFQDDLLGKTKADMFRSGTKLDRFVDASGREYTLDELRRREGVKPKPEAKPKPQAQTPAERRASIWSGKTLDEREKVAPAFENADVERLAIVEAAGNLFGGVKNGKGSYHSGSEMKIQMRSSHTGDAYKTVMRHEYGHHIDARIEQIMMERAGASPAQQKYAMGPSRLAREELKADAIALEKSVSGDTRNAWTGQSPAISKGFAEKVDSDRAALLSKYRKADRDGGQVNAIQSDFLSRGLEYDQARAMFPHMFSDETSGSGARTDAAAFLASFDNKDHVRMIYGGGEKMTHESPLSGISDSLGAATNQRIGYQFGHPKTYYAKFRSRDKQVSRILGDVDPFGANSNIPTGGKYAYGSGNTAQLWANWFEAYTSGSKTQYSVFKQMFPATSSRFERIVQEFAENGAIQ